MCYISPNVNIVKDHMKTSFHLTITELPQVQNYRDEEDTGLSQRVFILKGKYLGGRKIFPSSLLGSLAGLKINLT